MTWQTKEVPTLDGQEPTNPNSSDDTHLQVCLHVPINAYMHACTRRAHTASPSPSLLVFSTLLRHVSDSFPPLPPSLTPPPSHSLSPSNPSLALRCSPFMGAFKVRKNTIMESTKLAKRFHNIMVTLQDDKRAVILRAIAPAHH